MSFHCDEEEKHRQALLPTLGGDFPCDCRVYNAAAGVFSPLHSMKSYEASAAHICTFGASRKTKRRSFSAIVRKSVIFSTCRAPNTNAEYENRFRPRRQEWAQKKCEEFSEIETFPKSLPRAGYFMPEL